MILTEKNNNKVSTYKAERYPQRGSKGSVDVNYRDTITILFTTNHNHLADVVIYDNDD